mmetsp:Transcript_5251/g.10009  ORF Transcript_5251/g.10009 Transcript_5251/m.10009 type:complete len:204 (-) Transcript_5251:2099-2710(-)
MRELIRVFFAIWSFHSLAILVYANDSYCGNNLSFQFPDPTTSEPRDCIWVRYAEENIRQDFCQRSDIRSKCPYSCGICCENNPSFTLAVPNGGTKSCFWFLSNEVGGGYWCSIDWEETGEKIKDVCPVSCNNCPTTIKLINGAAAAEIEDDDSSAFPYAVVFGSVGGGLVLLGAIVLYRFKKQRPEDDLTFIQFIMTPSEWFA